MKLQTLKPRIGIFHARVGSSIATPRERGGNWTKRRAKLLEKHPLCVKCEEAGRTTIATEIDHIIPLCLGGSNDDSNLQNLCKACHDAKSLNDSSR